MRRLALFAHFDAQNQLKRYIVYFLEQLRRECEDIYFVSTSQLSDAELNKIRPFCSRILLKDNRGMDFGMWQRALSDVDLSAYDQLVLSNSSVFGPICPLGPVFKRMDESTCDFWGVTDNVEIAWHLQSYFLVFKRLVLISPAFAAFWGSVLPYRNKEQVIRSYEVGLSTYLQEAGFKAEALVPVNLVLSRSVAAQFARKMWSQNPTSHQPLRLIEAGCPFIKVELFRDNIGQVPLEPVRRAMASRGYDITLIEFDRPPRQRRIKPPWRERAQGFARGLKGALSHTLQRRFRGP